MDSPPLPFLALILAGGRARRLGGVDKALLELDGRPLIRHGLDRLRPQTMGALISANGDAARFQGLALAVLPDPGMLAGAGPLAGILAGLEWARAHRPECRALLSLPADTPFPPPDLARRLEDARGGKDRPALAVSLERRHPLVALWPLGLAEPLRHAVVREGLRKVDDFLRHQEAVAVPWPAAAGRDPFFNINTPEDLARAAAMSPSRL